MDWAIVRHTPIDRDVGEYTSRSIRSILRLVTPSSEVLYADFQQISTSSVTHRSSTTGIHVDQVTHGSIALEF